MTASTTDPAITFLTRADGVRNELEKKKKKKTSLESQKMTNKHREEVKGQVAPSAVGFEEITSQFLL